ncbi:MAG: ABC transporter permease subunit [Actinomycetota bacterium]|nr:ABC transporter permease subunit [Actinomycetota bacterium]
MTPRTAIGRHVAGTLQLLLSTWYVLPMIPLVLWAMARTWPAPLVLPSQWGPAGLTEALNDDATSAFAASLMLATLTAVLATPAGAMAAFALTFGRLRGHRALSVLLLAPAFVPPFVIVMGINVTLLRLHIPSMMGIVLVLIVTAIPYTTFVMRSALASYEIGFEDEARTLGASPRAVLVRIRIPMLAPAIATSAFLAFLVGWSDYVVTLLIGGGEIVSVPMRIAAGASGTGNDAMVAALSIAAAAPPLLLLLALSRLSQTPRRRELRASSSAQGKQRTVIGVLT